MLTLLGTFQSVQIEVALMHRVTTAGFATVTYRTVLLVLPILVFMLLIQNLAQYCLTLQPILCGWLQLLTSWFTNLP